MISEQSVDFILSNNLSEYKELFIQFCGPEKRRRAGEILSICGEPVLHMHFLLNGIVKVYTNSSDGFVRLLGYHRQNTLFVLDGFCEGKPAIVTTQAVTDITTVTVTRQSLLRMCEANPAFGLDLASYVGDVLRLMCFDAENQSVSDVTTRLINFIFLYMKSEDYCQPQCIPMSYENLASAVNASRIQIARICSKMKRLGVIDVGRRCITIKNPDALYDFTK